ncbi:glycosyltransferase family 4 protein [Variovorax sp. J22P271]|uniref:glycosyltransferase family 4 protein n=1 Tax=Variovorax davisae TaxID=3053515 RepID=UPI002576AED9|nr:glycosyltransferase family 4 protein [Variovorax sp. J22P271]MDM0035222.1 glycosyltransferase family 4 protein [Variovorax sp. J22P271]
MKLLLIHQNFPGQFRHLVQDLQQSAEHELLAIGRDTAPGLPGVELLRYAPRRQASTQTHPYLISSEDAVLHGQQVLRVLLELKARGYVPDVILAHPGWGETLFAKEAFPGARLVHFCEYYYHGRGADAGFDPEFPLSIDGAARIRARNAMHLLNLEQCDAGITPTHWQHGLHPAAYRDKISVVHEGVDVETLRPDPAAGLRMASGALLAAGQPIVTYVARNLEPLRGFHVFMRAARQILGRHPGCRIVVVGGDAVSYGSRPADAENWRAKMLAETGIDTTRVHFLGQIPHALYLKVLQVSAAHVYLTYPFVLSWSMLEAMASGCLLVGSDTAPVREVLRDGENGHLVDFFDVQGIAHKVLEVLHSPQRQIPLRANARETAARYGIRRGIEAYRRLLFEAAPPA